MKSPLKFQYSKTDFNFIAHFKDGKWNEGRLRSEDTFDLPMMATALHYGQQAFEGLKAYRRQDGRIQLFRFRDNAKRFASSCAQMMMPPVSEEFFMDAVIKTVLANKHYVPPYGEGASLYVRPFMIGSAAVLGLKPALEYTFAVLVVPVGPYFASGIKPIDLATSEFDRAAPKGTGAYKVGGNYSSSFYPQCLARNAGFADSLFLDPLTHTKIEEVAAANFFGIHQEGAYVTPTSPSILKSITNQSLMYLAKHHFKIPVYETDILIDQLHQLKEAGICGTAAVITPVRSITHQGVRHTFPTNDEVGEMCQKLYDLLTAIQFGDADDPNEWITILD